MKILVEEDCLITHSLALSHCVNEIIGPCRVQNGKVCVFLR